MCLTTSSGVLVRTQTRYVIFRTLDDVRPWCLPGFPHGKNGKIDAVVMVNFSPYFVANPGVADVKIVADHIEHIAGIAGKKQCV